MKVQFSPGMSTIMILFVISAILSRREAVAQKTEGEPGLQNSAGVFQIFANPPAEYRSAPLWVWNDRMTKQQIEEGLKDFQRQGIGGAFIHPRPGLITPYLSEEWLALCRYAVDVGKKLNMKIWIYDENSYPSGFAGGNVPAQMPDAVRSGLRMTRTNELPRQFATEPLLVLAKDSTGFIDITSRLKSGSFGAGGYRIFTLLREQPRPWYGGFTYVDLMRPEVTRKFIEITMGAYQRTIGDEFGKTVPGVFQDEAEINPASEPGAVVVNYTPALFDRFHAKWGYDLRTQLPSLFEETGNWQQVRHNFYSTLLDLFIDGWAKPYYEYCTANHLMLTGHYWEHDWPRPVINPDNMAFAAYAHIPGVDILMNDFQTDVHAQFGNARAVKEIRSAANQLGKERTLSETFGAGGWDMTFFDQKRIADWEYALGVNLLNQHLSYVTIKGARKRDHPLSFSYHEPWWKYYRPLGDYYGRLTVALCAGKQNNAVLVLEPTTTAWMYSSPEEGNKKSEAVGKKFQDFVNRLEAAQVEYDLASEDILRNHGSVQGRQLVVARRSYELLVLPSGLENLDESTLTIVRLYLAGGGRVLCLGDTPTYVEGKNSDKVNALSHQFPETWVRANEEGAPGVINRLSPPFLVFRDTSGAPASFNLLFHHRRTLADGELLFLANTDSREYQTGDILAPGKSCEQWDPFTGSSVPYPYRVENEKMSVPFSVPPGGSLLLCIRPVARTQKVGNPHNWHAIPPNGKATIQPTDPNVLTLDYCDLSLDGKTEKDLYFYQAQQKAYQHHGLDRNPWDNAVQFKSTLLEKDTFPKESGFEATFHFTIREGVKSGSMRAVVERPELFQVSVNGNPVKPRPNSWWLDKAFGVFDIGQFVKVGDNTIAMKSSPFSIYSELEPVYILGDFSLASVERGFEIIASKPIGAGNWNEQGMPFYARGVSYQREFLLTPDQLKGRRFIIELGKWNGVVAGVTVNGKESGSIAFMPFTLDVTRQLKKGTNSIAVTVYGSLKNTLGPHHNSPSLGKAWPGQFQQGPKQAPAPGSEYSTVGYGMIDDFTLNGARE